MNFMAIIALIVLLTSCAMEDDFVLSSGLKIFVTEELHTGDFANDPTLSGLNAIEKADDFCN